MKQRTVTDGLKRDLESLLEKFTSSYSFPRNVAPHNVRYEKYVCDICEEESQEAWAIPHFDWCIAGTLQALLLEESR